MKTHKYWAGTEETFLSLGDLYAKGETLKAQTAGYQLDLPPIYELHGSVGIIKIEGSLITGEAGIMRLYGMTGYQDIENAIVQGIKDPKAKTLMIYADSGGGSAKGVDNTGLLLKNAAAVKPMSAYVETAYSAAYWLTAAASHITIGNMGEAGSLGVIYIAMNRADQYAQQGIEVKVMRAGKYKALGNAYEKFSPEFEAQRQPKLDMMYEMFINHVAECRGVSYAVADQVMGQGLEFMGQQALDAGLVDHIGDMQMALDYAKINKTLANVKGM